ncbi:hypothetical protein VTJ83DRAFT_3207 [Remersonia thermophila]|uniref:RecQ-mediated genome instability protein 1 n=1 Tax=Remersonia thermophila TaxID=72144 RepID=A0ABR4DDC9_9PEZI
MSQPPPHREKDAAMSSAIARQLQTSLSTTSTPLPSLAWLHSLLSTRSQPLPPLASLLATVRARLLAADLTSKNLLDDGYAQSHSFPPQLAQTQATAPAGAAGAAGSGRGRGGGGGAGTGGASRETRLSHDVIVQVLDIQDISRPRWEQVEQLEALARGEGTRGREVIRLPVGGGGEEDGEEEDGGGAVVVQDQGGRGGRGGGGGGGGQGANDGPPTSNAPAAPRQPGPRGATHSLLLQDPQGQTLRALELKPVPRLGLGSTHIGEKMLLKAGTPVARGVVLLDPASCVVLGGKVEAWHRAWAEGRLERLRRDAGAPPSSSGGGGMMTPAATGG